MAPDPIDAKDKVQDLFLDLRKRFRTKLEEFIKRNRVAVIFEEGNKSETIEATEMAPSIAKEIAGNIPYHQINSAWHERIHKTPLEEGASVSNSRENFEERERTWIETIKRECCDYDQQLLIVGKDHIRNVFSPYGPTFSLDESLIQKLSTGGFSDITIVTEEEFWSDFPEYIALLECWKKVQPSL